MNNHSVIGVENLSFHYPDGTPALHDISLSIHQDERVGILGANGAGKSTFILQLNGILTGSGAVNIQGIPVEKKNFSVIRRKVGIIFQNPDDQLFCLTVYDDIAFGLRNMGVSEEEIKERVSESLEAVGLPGFENRCPNHLSTGEKKRVAIATIHCMRPEVFVLDEPTSSLDPKGRKSIMKLLADIGGTQVIVTHDGDLVKTLCSRAIVFYRGTVVYDGDSREVFTNKDKLEEWDLA